jgi:hypothetical protein
MHGTCGTRIWNRAAERSPAPELSSASISERASGRTCLLRLILEAEADSCSRGSRHAGKESVLLKTPKWVIVRDRRPFGEYRFQKTNLDAVFIV